MTSIHDFISDFAARNVKIALHDFVTQLSDRFYPDQDLSFMEYFLELASQDNDDKFVVQHQKLIEYGVTTEGQSSARVRDRLEALDLIEGCDYLLEDMIQQLPSGRKHSKTYMLTPDAFKIALMRAKKSPSQSTDPKKYAKYYLFLEKVIKYYAVYQKMIDDAEKKKLVNINNDLNTTQNLIMSKLDTLLDTNEKLVDQNNQLCGQSNQLLKKNDILIDEAESAKRSRLVVLNKLDTVVEMLQQKSIVSTMNPEHPKLHHNFVCMGYKTTNEHNQERRVLTFIAGQEVNVRTAMRKKFEDQAHNWTVQIGMHYNANPIDLRNNIHTKINLHVKNLIACENARRRTAVVTHNKKLRFEIIKHNLGNPNKRNYDAEKLVVERLGRGDIPITCTKTSATFIENDLMTFDELLEVIRSVNEETQKSPYNSPTDSPTESPTDSDDSS